jgi:hypothetical protein
MGVPDSPRGVVVLYRMSFQVSSLTLWQVSFFVLMLAFVFAFVGQCNSSPGFRPPVLEAWQALRDYNKLQRFCEACSFNLLLLRKIKCAKENVS